MGCTHSSKSRDLPTGPSLPARGSSLALEKTPSPPPSSLLRLNEARGFQRTNLPGYDAMYRIMILGDSGVGKSSVTVAFSSGAAPGNLPSTVGVDIVVKDITVDGKRVKLQMFDPAGHERNWMRVSNFGLWKSANAVVIMYDVTSMVSFQNCDIWISAVRLSAPANILATVVANKIDRDAERMVSEEEGKLFAENHNLDYFETSAATHVGINKLFESVAARLLALEQDDKPPNQASTS